MPVVAAAWLALWLGLGSRAAADGQPWPTHVGGHDATPHLSGLAERVHHTLQVSLRHHGAPTCRLSQRLSRAAHAHGIQLLRHQVPPGTLAPRTVRREVWRAGGVAPVVVPWAYAFASEQEPLAELPRFARRIADRPMTHCGVAVAQVGRRQIAVVVGERRHVNLEAFPVQLARGDRVRLAGILAPHYEAPTVLVSTPLAEVSRRRTLRRGGRFGTLLSFPLPGRYTVEVMANGPQGPEIVALFPVFVDQHPEANPPVPGELMAPPTAPDDENTLIQRLARLINDSRHRAGLPPFSLDSRLSGVARTHCLDMVRHHFFGHLDRAGADVHHRLRRAGLEAHRAAENLVRSTNAAQAHSRLMESPAHQSNVLDPNLTHLGLAAVHDEGEWLVTQIFVDW